MPLMQEVARELAREGKVDILQKKEKIIDIDNLKGIYRLRIPLKNEND